MKIIILLLALIFGFGASVKKSSDDLKSMQKRIEIKEYSTYPNLLPEVEIVADRS